MANGFNPNVSFNKNKAYLTNLTKQVKKSKGAYSEILYSDVEMACYYMNKQLNGLNVHSSKYKKYEHLRNIFQDYLNSNNEVISYVDNLEFDGYDKGLKIKRKKSIINGNLILVILVCLFAYNAIIQIYKYDGGWVRTGYNAIVHTVNKIYSTITKEVDYEFLMEWESDESTESEKKDK